MNAYASDLEAGQPSLATFASTSLHSPAPSPGLSCCSLGRLTLSVAFDLKPPSCLALLPILVCMWDKPQVMLCGDSVQFLSF